MQLIAAILIGMIVGTFMTLTFLAAWALTFLLGITGLGLMYAIWAIISIAGVIVLRKLARQF